MKYKQKLIKEKYMGDDHFYLTRRRSILKRQNIFHSLPKETLDYFQDKVYKQKK